MPLPPKPLTVGTVWAEARRRTPERRAFRFWARVIPNDAGCWEWVGQMAAPLRLYGTMRLPDGKRHVVHRVAYAMMKGDLDGQKYVCHSCDNPRCVNPSHLWLGTHADNIADMNAKGRARNPEGERTHCDHGHPFNAGNTWIQSCDNVQGFRRHCRACWARRYAVQKAARLQRRIARKALKLSQRGQ